MLVAGGLLMAVGMTGIDLAARHAAAPISPWALVPGMVVAGAGLGLLVVPLVNVVLAAVPVADAGGASGVFSTAQQFGGAIGVAVMGSVFFGHQPAGAGLTAAFLATMPWVIAAFVACAALCMLLPRKAVMDVMDDVAAGDEIVAAPAAPSFARGR